MESVGDEYPGIDDEFGAWREAKKNGCQAVISAHSLRRTMTNIQAVFLTAAANVGSTAEYEHRKYKFSKTFSRRAMK